MNEQPAGWYLDPTGRHQGRYWNGTDWSAHVVDDGIQGIDPSLASTGPSIQEPHSEQAGQGADETPTRRAPRWFVIVGVLAIAGIGGFLLYRTSASNSQANSFDNKAASACSEAAAVVTDYTAGERPAQSARSTLEHAEKTLQAAAHRYPAYQPIVQNIAALSHDIEAGSAQPSPADLANLNSFCGRARPPTTTR